MTIAIIAIKMIFLMIDREIIFSLPIIAGINSRAIYRIKTQRLALRRMRNNPNGTKKGKTIETKITIQNDNNISPAKNTNKKLHRMS
jgi:hypothetical protein